MRLILNALGGDKGRQRRQLKRRIVDEGARMLVPASVARCALLWVALVIPD
jgi:hypothetical protein